MIEDNRNPFSQEDLSTSQAPDLRFNQFSSEQARFPQFGNPSSQNAQSADIAAHIERAKSNGWGAQASGFVKAHKSKVLVIAVLSLLFAGGAYLSNKDARLNIPNYGKSDVSGGLAQAEKEGQRDNSADSSDSSKVNVLDIKIDEDGQVIFDDEGESLAQNDVSSITKTAERGEGITHLARRALGDYLVEQGKTLSREQAIYAEDYVKDLTGDEWLEVGQKLSFSRSLLDEAVQEAETLEDWQIENLKQYTSDVSLL